MKNQKKYTNLQKGEELDLERLENLPSNAMLKVKPELWIEWDFKKNTELGYDIWHMKRASSKRVWWVDEKGHEWESQIVSRTRGVNGKGSGCPYCKGLKVLKGFNDIWTTNPKLASWLADKNDGYRYRQTSNEYTDWICPNCNKIVKNKKISNVYLNGIHCHACSRTYHLK